MLVIVYKLFKQKRTDRMHIRNKIQTHRSKIPIINKQINNPRLIIKNKTNKLIISTND